MGWRYHFWFNGRLMIIPKYKISTEDFLSVGGIYVASGTNNE